MRLVCDYTRARDTQRSLSAIHSEAEAVGIEASFDVLGLEDNALSLAEGAKRTPFERAGPKVHLTAIVVSNDDPGPGTRVVGFDHTLHG